MMNLLLQKELNSLFNSLKFPFYDGIQDKGFPYGSFGYFTQDRNNTKTTKGNEIFMQLDLFSDYNGQKEIKEMINSVTELLEIPLVVNQKTCHLDSLNSRVQLEDHIYHGIIEVTFKFY
jgi:hypothetical protein